MPTKWWKQLLAPVDEMYIEFVGKVNEFLDGKSLKELRDLQKAGKMPSRSNCGWTLYQANKYLQDEVKGRIYALEHPESEDEATA